MQRLLMREPRIGNDKRAGGERFFFDQPIIANSRTEGNRLIGRHPRQ
jgi:hypothetical protein